MNDGLKNDLQEATDGKIKSDAELQNKVNQLQQELDSKDAQYQKQLQDHQKKLITSALE